MLYYHILELSETRKKLLTFVRANSFLIAIALVFLEKLEKKIKFLWEHLLAWPVYKLAGDYYHMRAWKAFSCSTYPKSRLERGRTAEKCTWCAGELKAYLLTPKHQSSLVRADQIGRANNLSNLHCWRHILLYSQRLSYFAFAWKWFYAEKISFSAGVPLTTFLCLQTFLAAWQIRMEGRVGKSTILHSCRISQTEKK